MIKWITILLLVVCTCLEAQWEKCQGISNRNITSLVTKGSKLYAGTIGAGLICSTDNGDTWLPKSDGISDTTIVSVKIAGENIYAGTRTDGIYQSTDDCITWFPINFGMEGTSVWSIDVKDDYIFAGTRDSGLYVSSDKGLSWKRKAWSQYIVAVRYEDGLLYNAAFTTGLNVSTDYGETWIERNNGLSDIDVRSLLISGSELFAGTSALGIFHSTDKGINWHRESISGDNYASVWAIEKVGNYLFLGDYYNGVFLSTDNGTHWEATNSGLTDSSCRLLTNNGKYLFAVIGSQLYRAKLSYLITGIGEVTINSNDIRILEYDGCLVFDSKREQEYEVMVYDLLGNVRFSGKNIKKIIKSDFPKGLYLCVIYHSAGITNYKFIVN